MQAKRKVFALLASVPLTPLQKQAFADINLDATKAVSQGVSLKYELLCPLQKTTACERFLSTVLLQPEPHWPRKIVFLVMTRDSGLNNHSDFLHSLQNVVLQSHGDIKVQCHIDGKRWVSLASIDFSRRVASFSATKAKVTSCSLLIETEIDFSSDTTWKKSLVKTALAHTDADCFAIFTSQSSKKSLEDQAKVCRELLSLVCSQTLLFCSSESSAQVAESPHHSKARSPLTFKNKTAKAAPVESDIADFSAHGQVGGSTKAECQSKTFSEVLRKVTLADQPIQYKRVQSAVKERRSTEEQPLLGIANKASGSGFLFGKPNHKVNTDLKDLQAKVSKETTPRSFIAISNGSHKSSHGVPMYQIELPYVSTNSSSVQLGMPPIPKRPKRQSTQKSSEYYRPETSNPTKYHHPKPTKALNLKVQEITENLLDDLSPERDRAGHSRSHPDSANIYQQRSPSYGDNIQCKETIPKIRTMAADLVQTIDDSLAKLSSAGHSPNRTAQINERPTASLGKVTSQHLPGNFQSSNHSSPSSMKLLRQLDSMKKMAQGSSGEIHDQSKQEVRQIKLALQAREEVCKDLQAKNLRLERENSKLQSQLNTTFGRDFGETDPRSSVSRASINKDTRHNSDLYVRISDLKNFTPDAPSLVSAKEVTEGFTGKLSFSASETYNPFQKLTKRQPKLASSKDSRTREKSEIVPDRAKGGDLKLEANKRDLLVSECFMKPSESPPVKKSRTFSQSMSLSKVSDAKLLYTDTRKYAGSFVSGASHLSPTFVADRPRPNCAPTNDALSRSLRQVLQTADRVIEQCKHTLSFHAYGDSYGRRSVSLGSHYRDMMLADLRDATRGDPSNSDTAYLLHRMLSRTLSFNP